MYFFQITVEDKIDLIKGNDILNPENLIIARLEILDMTPKGDNIRFAVRRFKNLVIEDYDEPYKPKSSEY